MMRGFEDIGSKGHFSAKKGGLRSKNPPRGSQIFLKLGTKLHLGETKKCFKRIFEKNSRLPPRGGFTPKNAPF